METRSEEARSGGVTIRMIGFDGRHQWRQEKLFKLRAKPLQCEIYINSNGLLDAPEILADVGRIQNLRFAHFLNYDSLNSCAPHKN
jgi:hypothetical protein